MKCYIALDVGGSTIKGTLTNSDGEIICTPLRFSSCSDGTKGKITEQLTLAVSSLALKAEALNVEICGIGFAFPGPFDYEKGISLMKGMGKFDSIYGVSLPEEINKRISAYYPMRFANDADLYALGEANFGEGKDFSRVMCICIGTGIGSGFCIDGKLIKSGDSVPDNGWIYNSPYKDSIADAYASASGIRRMIRSDPALNDIPDVRELAEAAHNGNKSALALFSRFGEILRDVVLPHAIKFKADCLVVGGDVAKSGELFLAVLEKALNEHRISLRTSRAFSDMTLRAVPVLFKNEI